MKHCKHSKHCCCNLSDLLPGEQGTITAIKASDEIRQRLMDMGIIEGMNVEMVREAPLGDPIQIKVLDTQVALRKSEAGTIAIDCHGVLHARKACRHRFGWKSKFRKDEPV